MNYKIYWSVKLKDLSVHNKSFLKIKGCPFFEDRGVGGKGHGGVNHSTPTPKCLFLGVRIHESTHLTCPRMDV